MNPTTGRGILALVLALSLSCACSKPSPTSPSNAAYEEEYTATGPLPQRYDDLLRRFAEHDRLADWDVAACSSIGMAFVGLSKRHERHTKKPLAPALYNAGLAFARCGDRDAARERLKQAHAAQRDLYAATTQLILFDHLDTPNLDATIERLEAVVRASRFGDQQALVKLAALQMERGRVGDGRNDLEEAKKNLQRALAIDDGSLSAMNQLALYYLKVAKRRTGQRGSEATLELAASEQPSPPRQQLDAASLVAARGLGRNPNYAPLHNTVGLIRAQLKDYTGASRAFARARELDPKFFEAHMNYAALNSMFRGFGEAEHAYRDALDLRPGDYEAHLGLALALRGQLDAKNQSRLLPEIERELDLARKAAPGRPEADYNQAIVTQEVKAQKSDEQSALAELKKAANLLRRFLKKAENKSDYESSVARARERLEELEETIEAVQEGLRLQQARGDRTTP